MDLNHLWYILLGALFIGYAILDGFDFGVGICHLFAKTDEERRILLNSIGPVWDGNEVWLVTAGGALFAAFPKAYATLTSGMYAAVYLLLFCLIFRAVAIEFRSKEPMIWWRRFWDISFFVSSLVAPFVLGVAAGNLVWGLPLDEYGEFSGTFCDLLHPYALLVGITTVSLFAMHGALYAHLKTEGVFQQRIRDWIHNTEIFFIVCYGLTTVVTLIYLPHMAEPMRRHPVLFVIALINLLAVAGIPREVHHRRPFWGFIASCLTIATLIILLGIGLYPYLVPAHDVPEHGLTLYNAASTDKTLLIMTRIALIGMPFVLGYTTIIHWVFRGKVRLGEHSY